VRFEYIRIRGSLRAFIAILATLFVFFWFFEGRSSDYTLDLVYLFATPIAFYLDYVQSAVLASLVGILVSTYVQSRNDSRLMGALGFLLLQTLTYLFPILVGLVMLPQIHDALHFDNWLAEFSAPAIVLATFYVVREGVIYGLVSMVTRRLKAA
jgi:hypothetical protein